jgi:membrane-associated protease RseP (regulator of RpoE activity)
MDSLQTLAAIVAAWFIFYAVVKLLKINRGDLEVSPIYALYKSTKLNGFITRLANWKPMFWRVLGNVGVVTSIGQASFATWLLLSNLIRFFVRPEQASPVQPLIPGVTIGASSLPWFFLAAGVVILTHELSHGIQCVLEGVRVKSSAILFAVITFGGAVEPEEEDLKAAPLMSKMRIFAAGSIVNLITGLLVLPFTFLLGRWMPEPLIIFLSWLYFIAVNLAIINMLPIGPLDGGQMWRAFTEGNGHSKVLQQIATYGFIALIGGNIAFSLARFGLVPL